LGGVEAAAVLEDGWFNCAIVEAPAAGTRHRNVFAVDPRMSSSVYT
jgi:hypothetical protein